MADLVLRTDELDGRTARSLFRVSDGDTGRLPIRLLGLDTPETMPFSGATAVDWDDRLQELARRIRNGEITSETGNGIPLVDGDNTWARYLVARLGHGLAGSVQGTLGKRAEFALSALIEEAAKGGDKAFILRTNGDDVFDIFGRVLALVAIVDANQPNNGTLSIKETLNYKMVESGWAAPFSIYDKGHPSMTPEEMQALHAAARTAFTEKRGIWQQDLALIGYEFRPMTRLPRPPSTDGNSPPDRRFVLDIQHPANPIVAPAEYNDKFLSISPPDRVFGTKEDLEDLQQQLLNGGGG